MSYNPIQDKDKVFFTLVRGNSSWNDVIETNSDYIENSGDTIRTKDNKSIPMFAECCISYVNNEENSTAATWSYKLNSSDAQFKWGQFRGWVGGSYVVGDDKAIGTNTNSFTYTINESAGSGLNDYTRNNAFSSTILYFPESI